MAAASGFSQFNVFRNDQLGQIDFASAILSKLTMSGGPPP